MAALSAQFAAISPGMDLDTATDGLVSTMKAFGYDVNEVEREVMDVINKTGNTMATTNEEIVNMLERSSAAMAAANNSLKETTALESAAVQITRNAETTGTAFRTISMKIRGYDEETEEYIGGIEELSGKIADLTKTAKTPGGLSLFTDASKSEYKSTYQILKEISEIYKDLSDANQAELLETLAGKRGGQVLAGILSDFSEVERAMRNMEESAGSADAEMSIVEESLTYKINKLKETWVGVLQELIDNGTLGKAVDGLVGISEALGNIVTLIGPIGVGIAALGIAGLGKDLNKLPTILNGIAKAFETITKMSKGELVGESLSSVISDIGFKTPKTITAVKGLGKAILGLPGPVKIAAAAIGILVAVVLKTKQANDELRKSASKLSEQYSDSQKELSDYKEEIEELYDVINDENSSYNDSREAREKLLDIQTQLLEKYGQERDSINLVTDAINGQVDALDRLTERQWAEALNEFNTQNLPGIDWINRLVHGTNTNVGVMKAEMENVKKSLRFSTQDYDFAKQMAEAYGGSFSAGMGDVLVTLSGNLDEVYDKMLKIQQAAKDSGTVTEYSLGELSTTASKTKEILDQYEGFYNQYNLYERIFNNDDYEHYYQDMIDAYQKYQKAFANGDKELAEKYKEDISTLFYELRDKIGKDGLTPEETGIYNTLRSLFPDLQAEIDKYTLKAKLDLDTSDEEKNKLAEEILAFGNEEALVKYVNGSDPKLQEFYDHISQYAKDAGVDVAALVALMRELGLLKGFGTRNLSATTKNYAKSVGKGQVNGKTIREYGVMESALSNLDEDTYAVVATMGETQWKKFNEELERTAGTTDLVVAGVDNVTAALEATAEEYTKVKEASESTEYSIAESVTGISTRLKSQFDELGTLYDKVFNGDNGFDLSEIDNSDLQGIVDNFTKFNEELGLTAEEQEHVKDVAEDFMRVLTNESSTAEDVQDEFNKIATAYFYAADGQKEINEQTAAAIKQQLEQMGIMNADDVVAYYQTLANGEEVAAQNNIKLKTATADAITELVTVGKVAPAVGQALAVLAIQERIAAGVNFSESSNIAELEALAKAAGITGSIMADLARAKTLVGLAESGKASAGELSELTVLQDKIKSHDYTQDFNIDFSKIGGGSGSAGSAGSDAGDAYVEAFEKELEALEKQRDAGIISESEFLEKYRDLIERYFKDVDGYGEEYAERMADYWDRLISHMENVVSAIGKLLDRKKEAAEKGKEAAVSALEEEQKAAEKYYQNQIDYIDGLIDALEDEKDALQDQIDVLNDQIEAINDANTAREHSMALQKAQYELERSMSQRTRLVYTGEVGQMRYERDESAVRSAQEGVKEAEDQLAIDAIEKQIKLLEKQQELIDDQIDAYKDQQEALQKMLDASNEYYENLISQTEEYWDSLIDAIENQKSKWEELVEQKEIAEAFALVQDAMRALGYTVDDVLNDTPGAFEAFRDAYLQALTDANANNQDFLDGLNYATSGAKTAFGEISSSAGEIESALGKVADATAPLSTAASNIEAVGKAASTASTEVGKLKDACPSECIDNLNNANFNGLETAIDGVKTKLEDITNLLTGPEGSIQSALDKLNDPTVLEQLGNAFTELSSSITQVATALGVGGGGGNGEQDATESSSRSMSEGATEGGAGLAKAIEEIKIAADTFIGMSADDEGETAIGRFNLLKSAIQTIIDEVLGNSEIEGTLLGNINSLLEVTNTALYGGDGDEGAIHAFDEFRESIAACAEAAGNLMLLIQQLESMSLPTFEGGEGGEGQNYTGTANYDGDWRVGKNEKSLVGELGPEIVLRNGKAITVGKDGPEFVNLKKDDVVLNHLQSKAILDKKNQVRALADGTVLSPLSSSALNLQGKIQQGFRNAIPDLEGIQKIIKQQTTDLSSVIQKNNTPNISITNPQFTVTGVSGEQVMRQIEGAFEGLMLNAYQKAMS